MRQKLLRIVEAGGRKEFYWGIISKEEQAKINHKLDIGLLTFKDLDQFNFNSGRFDYALDKNRGNVIKLLEDNKDFKVLEIGCGYGGITEILAKKYGHVDALDATFELLDFTRHRLEYFETHNVTLFHTSVFESDFEKHLTSKYDLIVINGVLEWVGSGLMGASPRDYQKIFLEKCERLLTEEGQIFLAIENRWYPKWWLRDPHSKLPFTTILPRKVANIYSKRKQKVQYRTWIYSRFGLVRLLRSTNLAPTKEYYVLMTYRSPKWISDSDEFRMRKNVEVSMFNSTFWRFISSNSWLRSALFPYILPSFVFLVKSRGRLAMTLRGRN